MRSKIRVLIFNPKLVWGRVQFPFSIMRYPRNVMMKGRNARKYVIVFVEVLCSFNWKTQRRHTRSVCSESHSIKIKMSYGRVRERKRQGTYHLSVFITIYFSIDLSLWLACILNFVSVSANIEFILDLASSISRSLLDHWWRQRYRVLFGFSDKG